MEPNKLKDSQLLLDTISADVSEYAYDTGDSNFEVIVKICCVDGWVSSDFIDVNSLKSISEDEIK